MNAFTLSSPAKLNLSLRIVRRRPDGYHELVTLFHRISLKDSLFLRKTARGFRLICRGANIPPKNNLITRAWEILKKRFPSLGGVHVRLVKKIPVGGGLGGGSSNAASFLLGANRLLKLGLKKKALMELGAELGSDVPFFISGSRHARGEGRGEKIHSLPFKGKLWFLLFPSKRGLSTKQVYAGFRLPARRASLTLLGRDARIASIFLEKRRLRQAADFLINDLMESAEKIRPSLKKRRQTLTRLHLGMCQMSGSGPTQFITFASRHRALEAMRRLRRLGFSNFLLCHTA